MTMRGFSDIQNFENDAGLNFRDKNLLRQAFTHRSYLNENRNSSLKHNERLEFLGDAVLELVVTDYLYNTYPEYTEGDMTSFRSAVVNADNLFKIGTNLNIDEYLMLSRGEAKDKGRARQYIIANTVEAIIGAIYLDSGYEADKKFVHNFIIPEIEKIISSGTWIDSKSLFQEKAQDLVGTTPSYRTEKESGPDHDKHFTVGVYLRNDLVAIGEGRSKQDAEQEAAKKALEIKEWN